MKLPNTLKTPALLQKLQWVIDPVGYMEQAAQQHPDLFTAEIVGFGDTVVFLYDPQAIQEVLTNDRKKFVALSQGNRFLQPIVGDYSIAMLEGERHRKRRQLLLPPLHGERLQAYSQLICNLTDKIFSQLPQNQSFSACVVTQQISVQVILEVIFGLSQGKKRYQELEHLLMLAADIFQSHLAPIVLYFSFLQKDLGFWSPWGKFVRIQQQIDELIYAEIAERREQFNPHCPSDMPRDRIDILSLLLSARDEMGNSITDLEVRCELMTLLLAGQESTASAMAWGLYWVHQLPHVHEKLLCELNSLGGSPDPMSLVRLPYLTAVCHETLRIAPAVMVTFPRIVQESVELLGHRLEPGMVVLGCVYLTHQREDLYPQPKQFKPERFLERQFSPYEFMPFGGGARGCIGGSLAQFELKLVLATILSKYQLELADHRPEQLRRRGITLAPTNGIKMKRTKI